MEGWIKLHRKLLDNPIAKKANYLAIWVYLLLNANHADNDTIIDNQRTTIKRGQLLTSIAKIADHFKMSTSTVSRILDYFISERMIERSSTFEYTIISVQNYDRYQEVESKVESWEKAGRKLSETNNNDKNEKNEKKRYLTAEKKSGVETFEELLRPDAPIRYDWQYLALEIIEKLDVPENKRSAFFKACKENQARCQAALTFAVDFPNPKLRWNMFFVKYNELKNRKELSGEHP